MSPPQTLIRNFSSSSHLCKSTTPFNCSRNRSCFFFSTLPDSSPPLPADAVAGDSSSPNSSHVEAFVVRVIEDAVHGVIVSRSTPDWLPFVPGASYWVPPKRRNYGVAQLLRNLTNAHLHDVDHDHLMSLITSRRCWPSSHYYPGDANVINNDSSSDESEAEEGSSSDDMEF